MSGRYQKVDNILTDERNSAMLMDFGCSQAFTGGDSFNIEGRTPVFMAPEVCWEFASGMPQMRSDMSKTDVQSFGMLLCDKLCGKVLYLDLFPNDGSDDAFAQAAMITRGETPAALAER